MVAGAGLSSRNILIRVARSKVVRNGGHEAEQPPSPPHSLPRESTEVIVGAAFLTPWAIFGLLLGFGLLALNLLLAFSLYPPSFLWSAFLHPKWGSLIWTAIPVSASIILFSCPVVSLLTTPRRLILDASGVTFEFALGRMITSWNQFRRPVFSFGRFGATVRFISPRSAKRTVSVPLSTAQAAAIMSRSSPESWDWAPDLANNAATRAYQGRYKSA